MEQCPWDCARTHHLASSIHPTVWELPAWNRLLCEQQKILEDFVFCVNVYEISYVRVSDGNTFIYCSRYCMPC